MSYQPRGTNEADKHITPKSRAQGRFNAKSYLAFVSKALDLVLSYP
jgi:hypothetical protein